MLKTFVKNAGVTFFSRVLGFVRDILLARYLGASWGMDAFLIAFKLPNLFRRLVAEGAFSQALIPAVIKAQDSTSLLQQLFGGLLVIVIIISIPFMVFPHKVLALFIYGVSKESEVFLMAAKMLPWVFPYLFCMACCGFYTAQLNIAKHYFIGSVLPVALNLCLIAGGLMAFKTGYLMWIAYAVFLAGVIQLLVCMMAVYFLGGVLLPRSLRLTPPVKQVVSQVSAAFLAQIMAYFSSLFDLLIASFLMAGSLSWLYYAERLAYFPVGVVSVVLANMVLPQLSAACHAGSLATCRSLLNKASLIIALIGTPMVLGGWVLAHDIISVLFSSSSFQSADVAATVASFRLLLLAVPAFMLNKVWGSLPFAFSESQVQLRMVAQGVLAGVVVTGLSFKMLNHVAISLGGGVSAWGGYYGLCCYARSKIQYQMNFKSEMKHILLAGVVMAFVVMMLDQFFPGHIVVSRYNQLLLLGFKVGVGAGVYLGLIYQSRTVLDNLYQPSPGEGSLFGVSGSSSIGAEGVS